MAGYTVTMIHRIAVDQEGFLIIRVCALSVHENIVDIALTLELCFWL